MIIFLINHRPACLLPCVHRVPAARTLADSVANRGRPNGRAGSHAGVSTERTHPTMGRNGLPALADPQDDPGERRRGFRLGGHEKLCGSRARAAAGRRGD